MQKKKKQKPAKERKESRLHVRLTNEQRAKMEKAASRANLDLSNWVRMVSLAAAEENE